MHVKHTQQYFGNCSCATIPYIYIYIWLTVFLCFIIVLSYILLIVVDIRQTLFYTQSQ